MKLTPNEISYLSASFRGQNPLSLFSNITKAPDGSEYKSLSEKGIIVNNAYEAKALDILLLLTKPEKCSRLVIQNPFFVAEKYTYKIGERLIVVENDSGAFNVSEPEDLTNLIVEISKFVSMSSIQTADITELFTPDELLVLLAIFDIYRKKTLAGYIEGKTPEIKVWGSEISSELANGFVNGLAKSVLKNYNLKMPGTVALDKLLHSLEAKGCITAGTEMTLTPVYAIFAKNYLIPENVILYEMFELDENGGMMAESTLAITAGIHDIITFTFDKETFKVETPSAANLVRAIEITLECPSFEKEVPAATVPPVTHTATAPAAPMRQTTPQQDTVTYKPAADGSWKCKCGAVNKGNFCVNCGTRKS